MQIAEFNPLNSKLAIAPTLMVKISSAYYALAGVAQWIKCQPANQRVICSIPSQGTCLGCGPGPPVERHMRGNHTMIFLSLSFSLPSLLSKK